MSLVVMRKVTEMVMILSMWLWCGYHCGVVAIVVDTAMVKRIKHKKDKTHMM